MTLSLLFVFPPTPLEREEPIFIEWPQSPEKMIELGVRRPFPSWHSHRVTLVKSLLKSKPQFFYCYSEDIGFNSLQLNCAVASEYKEPYPVKLGPCNFFPCCHLSSILLQRCMLMIYEAENIFLWHRHWLVYLLPIFSQKRT